MNTDRSNPVGLLCLPEYAAHPLADLGVRLPLLRLPLLRLLAGMSLRRRCFAADTRPNAPSDAPNCGFQVK
jgi:hypothetical protein